jgi:hypothetical protein
MRGRRIRALHEFLQKDRLNIYLLFMKKTYEKGYVIWFTCRRIQIMRHKIHYLLTALWGLASPALMGWVTMSFLEKVQSKEHMGHGTPVEFVIVFLLIGLLCLGVFLVFDLVSAVLFLPKDGRRKRHFLLALLLYIVVGLLGWLVIAVLEDGANTLMS